MGGNVTMLVFGVILVIIGIENIRGNIASIHWYNRTRITEETRAEYGKYVGIGTLIIAGGLILSAVLNMLVKAKIAMLAGCVITLITVVVGIAFILYAQFKFNKGIF
ncbi:MAG: hypothetical protein E7583_07345 [Ruminococcaceae bacterium]|nr:hypothetical protein [Oscillospiraceae bacterium]